MSLSISTVVSAQHITHQYQQNIALDDVSIAIPSGKMVGLIGPDGVGKSTLMALISGARKLQQGSLQVLEGNIDNAEERAVIGPRIAYMPQGLGKNLYAELSVQENLDFFGKLFNQTDTERASRIATLTQATGLQGFLQRPAGKLSGGMKQKLGLCCALIHDPDLLLLDEPTTGVDPLSRQQFWTLIESIRLARPRMSVIVSTAYMDEAERFDYLIAMDAGKILNQGSPQSMKTMTESVDLETAFLRILPAEKRANHSELVIPPLKSSNSELAIVAVDLTRKFGDFTAVNQVSFEIQQGEIFGFLGSNGCGKTTTMKMLTGLLPLSSGKAYLFGKAVNANDVNTRRRVGFMSQAFSLYDELTVEQNLLLHARLYHLTSEHTQLRIAELVQRFGLSAYMENKAAALPLGMRQRLSLAVAVIHEPEMLILDEPTSGVDPVARDEFWELLVSLSRHDNVTIFISTHFMNEAMRCDRISLMHAGEVLVYGTPQQLIENQASSTLEQAFIAYLQHTVTTEQVPEQESAQLPEALVEAVSEPAAKVSVNPPLATAHLSRFSIHRLLAFSYLEAMQVLRDPVRLSFAFIGSTLLLMVISYGISLDVEELRYAALDNDQTPESRAYLNQFTGSRYFIKQPEVTSIGALETQLQANQIALAIEIPPGFGKTLKKGLTPAVSIWIDGSNTTRSGTIAGYVNGVHAQYITQLYAQSGIDLTTMANITIESRYRFNPAFESIYSIGPKTPALLLLLFPAILMAVSISREKEIGTITNFYVTPTHKFEYLLGKQLPYIIIGLLNFLILTLMVIVILQVPLKGSFIGLFIGAFFYVFASTGFGLLIASITRTQVASIFATAILCMLPTLQFSGIFQPTSTLEGAGKVFGTLWPATYYMHLSVAAFTKGLVFWDLIPDILVLVLFGPTFVSIAAVILKKQED